jgi:inositol phosphorylceramide mannosyltransferase catalytic subunit
METETDYKNIDGIANKISKISKIPKIIHIIWIGNKRPPWWCINSWRHEYCVKYTGWKFILWTEKELNDENMIKMKNRKIYDSEPTLRGKSDIARYEILYQYGGIFLDADSYWIDNNKDMEQLINETYEWNCELFCGNEPKNKLYANGVIGSIKGGTIVNNIIAYLDKNYMTDKTRYNHKHAIWQVTGPVPFTNVLLHTNAWNYKIFPYHYFFPETYKKDTDYPNTEDMALLFPDSYMYQYWLSHTEEYQE